MGFKENIMSYANLFDDIPCVNFDLRQSRNVKIQTFKEIWKFKAHAIYYVVRWQERNFAIFVLLDSFAQENLNLNSNCISFISSPLNAFII